ncbi:MAG: Hsp20/alpha crystallin family protein [Chloroflexia bacterium]
MLNPYQTRGDFGSSVWRDMARLQDEMNKLFSTVAQPTPVGYPAVNFWTGEDSLILTSELPGVTLDGLDISVVGDTLTLRGTRAPEQLPEGATYHRRERQGGRFTRVHQLPFRVEPDEVSATLKNGLLNITLPRAHADRPRKIQVKSV